MLTKILVQVNIPFAELSIIIFSISEHHQPEKHVPRSFLNLSFVHVSCCKAICQASCSGIYNNFLDYIFSLKVPMFFPRFAVFLNLFLKRDYQMRAGISHIFFNIIHRNKWSYPLFWLLTIFFLPEFKVGKISNTKWGNKNEQKMLFCSSHDKVWTNAIMLAYTHAQQIYIMNTSFAKFNCSNNIVTSTLYSTMNLNSPWSWQA